MAMAMTIQRPSTRNGWRALLRPRRNRNALNGLSWWRARWVGGTAATLREHAEQAPRSRRTRPQRPLDRAGRGGTPADQESGSPSGREAARSYAEVKASEPRASHARARAC